jgi:hypothetical protein
MSATDEAVVTATSAAAVPAAVKVEKKEKEEEELHAGPLFHSSHRHRLKLVVHSTVKRIIVSFSCDLCKKSCSGTRAHCIRDCDHDVCRDCWADEVGRAGMRDEGKCTSALVAECAKEHVVEYADFRELLDTVEACKGRWTDAVEGEGHERLLVSRTDAKGDSNANRRVLIYHVPTKTLILKTFEVALSSPDYDHTLLRRLNGFEIFGSWSQKGDFIYLIWSREELVVDFLPQPPGFVSQILSYFW